MKASQNIFFALLLILVAIFVFNDANRDTTLSFDQEDLVDSGLFNDPSQFDKELLEKRIIILTKEVNQYSAKRIIASLLLLDAQDPEKEINFYINTGGGWLCDAFAIIDTMQSINAPVNTIATGDACSSGMLLLAAGTGKRLATSNALVMVHTNVVNYDEQFDYDTLEYARYLKFCQDHTNIPLEWIQEKADESYYLSATEALKYNIIDAIHNPKSEN